MIRFKKKINKTPSIAYGEPMAKQIIDCILDGNDTSVFIDRYFKKAGSQYHSLFKVKSIDIDRMEIEYYAVHNETMNIVYSDTCPLRNIGHDFVFIKK